MNDEATINEESCSWLYVLLGLLILAGVYFLRFAFYLTAAIVGGILGVLGLIVAVAWLLSCIST